MRTRKPQVEHGSGADCASGASGPASPSYHRWAARPRAPRARGCGCGRGRGPWPRCGSGRGRRGRAGRRRRSTSGPAAGRRRPRAAGRPATGRRAGSARGRAPRSGATIASAPGISTISSTVTVFCREARATVTDQRQPTYPGRRQSNRWVTTRSPSASAPRWSPTSAGVDARAAARRGRRRRRAIGAASAFGRRAVVRSPSSTSPSRRLSCGRHDDRSRAGTATWPASTRAAGLVQAGVMSTPDGVRAPDGHGLRDLRAREGTGRGLASRGPRDGPVQPVRVPPGHAARRPPRARTPAGSPG